MTKDGKMILMGYSVLVMALIAFGVIMFVQTSEEFQPGQHSLVPWQTYSEAQVAAAQQAGKPVMIDFYAVWCGPCRYMDYNVYSSPEVAAAVTNFLTIRVDVSDQNNEASRKIAEKYNIAGLPTVVFLGTNGQERTLLRLLGKEEPARLIQRLKAVQ